MSSRLPEQKLLTSFSFWEHLPENSIKIVSIYIHFCKQQSDMIKQRRNAFQIDKFAYPVKWNDSIFIHKNKFQNHEEFLDLLIKFRSIKIKKVISKNSHGSYQWETLFSVCSLSIREYNKAIYSRMNYFPMSITLWNMINDAPSNCTSELYAYYFAFTILIVW